MQTIQSTAKIKVAVCTDYNDKSKPSSSLLEANDLIKKLFPISEFQECKREDFDSVATHLVPMDIGTLKEEKFVAKNITIIKNKYDNVFFCFPQNIVVGIKKYKQRKRIKNFDFTINVRYVNDSDKDVTLDVLSAYIDSQPSVHGKATIPPNNNINFVFSNVSSDQARQEGIAFLFSKTKNKKE